MWLTKEDRFFLLKKTTTREKKHVWEMEAYTGETVSSAILEGSNMESTFALTFPCQRWRQKHTHSRHLNSLTDWKSLLVFTFKWLHLIVTKGVLFPLGLDILQAKDLSQITPPAVPVEVHGNPQHRRGARTSMLILNVEPMYGQLWHIYRYRRG